MASRDGARIARDIIQKGGEDHGFPRACEVPTRGLHQQAHVGVQTLGGRYQVAHSVGVLAQKGRSVPDLLVQILRVGPDHGQGRFEVMGERGHLVALRPLRRPARLKRICQRGAHAVHRREDVVDLADSSRTYGEVQVLLGDVRRRVLERRELAADASRARAHQKGAHEQAAGACHHEPEALHVGEGVAKAAVYVLRQVGAGEHGRPSVLKGEAHVGGAVVALDTGFLRRCAHGRARAPFGLGDLVFLHVGGANASIGGKEEVMVGAGDVRFLGPIESADPRGDFLGVGGPPGRLVDDAGVDERGHPGERDDPHGRDADDGQGEVLGDMGAEGHPGLSETI